MNIRFGVFGFFCFFLVIVECSSAIAKNLPIPSGDEYSNFLLEPWKPNAPVLMVFTDPFCPYCIKALKRKEELKPYNTYLFWYPIFGERSDLRVAEIFECLSPVSSEVINAVVEGKSPGCGGPRKESLMHLNRNMYEAYSPPGVPAYYMGGVKVSVGELKAWRKSLVSVTPSVALEWPRYNANRLNINTDSLLKVIVLLPNEYKKTSKLISSLKENVNYDWHLFEDKESGAYKNTCQYLVGKCELQALKQYVTTTQEIKLLYNINNVSAPVFILNGKILSEAEKVKYFNFLKDFI